MVYSTLTVLKRMIHQKYVLRFVKQMSIIYIIIQCSAFKPEEYALSRDLDVALWQQCRRVGGKPELDDLIDFVVVTAELHDDLDAFKRAEIKLGYSFVPVCELLLVFCQQQSDLRKCCQVNKFGKHYFNLSASQMDKFITWVYEMRECYHSKGKDFLSSEVQNSCMDS